MGLIFLTMSSVKPTKNAGAAQNANSRKSLSFPWIKSDKEIRKKAKNMPTPPSLGVGFL